MNYTWMAENLLDLKDFLVIAVKKVCVCVWEKGVEKIFVVSQTQSTAATGSGQPYGQ